MKAYKGNILFTKESDHFEIHPDSYLLVENGKVAGVADKVEEGVEVEDFGNQLIIPGFVDVHLHAPQNTNAGLGMDKELLPWLNTYTFPEEAKYKDKSYYEKNYKLFVQDLWRHGTTRAVVFATLHKEATLALMDYFREAGLGAMVGKVNMNRNSPEFLVETTEDSLRDTEEILAANTDKDALVRPIVTPRFVPSTDEELMTGLAELAKKYDVPVQSHLDENRDEIGWVLSMHPDCDSYAGVYDKYELYGQQPTIMAHCNFLSEEEIALTKERGVYVAHCPISNFDLASGIAPIRRYMNEGIPVGLGSDVSGGHDMAMNRVMVAAAQASKMRFVYLDEKANYLSTPEIFFLGTKGGGAFFGNVGSFEEGYEADFLVIDDKTLQDSNDRSLAERLERFLYIGDDRQIVKRFVRGNELAEPFAAVKRGE